MLSKSRKQEIQDCDQLISQIEDALEEADKTSVSLLPGDFSNGTFVGVEVKMNPDGQMGELEIVGIDKGEPYTIEYTELDTLGTHVLTMLLQAVQRRL